MVSTVVDTNEISLNGVRYPITKPVQSLLASIYPGKIVIGDTDKDSQLRTSIISWTDFRGGIGINRMEGAGDVNRAWWSTAQLRYKNHLVLPGLATKTTSPSHSRANPAIGAINTYGNEVYAAWNGSVSEDAKIYKYNNTNDSWGEEDQTNDRVTDSIVFTDSANNSYLVFAHYDANGSGYTYYNGSSWSSNDTQATQFLTVWDERLWGISNAGQLWHATTIGTEIADALLPLPNGFITALFVARNAAGVPIIYAATKVGLFAHDADNSMWVETQMDFPIHPENGKGTIRWRDSVFIPSGLGVYKYINGGNSAVVTVVGPDRDDGLPADKRGAIRAMAGSHNELLVGIDAAAAPASIASTSIPYQWQSHQGAMVIAADSGYSAILGYNELGWECKWQSDDRGVGFGAMAVSSAYDVYRTWWGHAGDVYFMAIPSDIINPSEVSEFAYALTATHETPWFNAGQSEVDKLALKLRTEVQGSSSTETVKVEYALNYAEDYTTAIASITSDGLDTYSFGSGVGVDFRAIKFRLTLDRSTADTTGLEKFKTPDVVSLTLEFRKKLPAKWGHSIQVDLNNEYKGKNPKGLRSSLISAIESTTLVEFTFRDDSGGTRNYYVDVVSATGVEFTGSDERGFSTISVMEP